MAIDASEIIATTDSQAAVYNVFKTGVADTLTRLVTLRGVLDGYNDAPSYQHSIDSILALELKLKSEDADPSGTLEAEIERLFGGVLEGLDDDSAKWGEDNAVSTITDLKSWLQYHNYGDGGPWAALMAPLFAELYLRATGAPLGAKNTYSPAISDMGSREVGQAFEAGDSVVTASYAGVARPRLTSTGVTGSGMVTVIGDGYDESGLPVSGRAWQVNVSSNTTADLTPVVAGDILHEVTGITYGAGLSAGVFQVIGAVPNGRTSPPV